MDRSVLMGLVMLFLTMATVLPATTNRTVLSLNSVWDCEEVLSAQKDTIPSVWNHKIPVPGLSSLAIPGLGNFDYLFYRKTFVISSNVPSQAILKIHKGYWGKKVWINGSLVGEHFPIVTPAYLNMKPFLLGNGQTNVLIVRVGTIDTFPTGYINNHDYEKMHFYPGLYDNVDVILTGSHMINRVQTAPDLGANRVRVVARITNSSAALAVIPINLEVRESSSGTVAGTKNTNISLNAGAAANIDAYVSIAACHLWTPEDPFLYRLHIKTDNDTSDVTFGMRTFYYNATTKKPTLNGSIYMLRGSNFPLQRFFDDPERGQLPWNKAWVRKVIQAHKALNMNSVRYHVGLAPEIWYEVADEEGFLVDDEYPIWTLASGPLPNGTTASGLQLEVTDWIYERNNHPCVMVWDICNESWNADTLTVVNNCRGIDIQNRPWDNCQIPGSPTDSFEDHPYFNQYLSGWTPEYFAEKGMIDQYSAPPNPVSINEYGWLWIYRDGLPTPATMHAYEARLTNVADAQQTRYLHDTQMAMETEWFRANRYATVQQFTGLSYNIPGGVTSDNWLPGITNLLFADSFKKYMSDAMAPVGLMIGYWKVLEQKGSSQTIPVYVMNDNPSPWSGDVTLKIVMNSNIRSSVTHTYTAVPTGYRAVQNYFLTFPNISSNCHLIAEYTNAGKTVQSVRDLWLGIKPRVEGISSGKAVTASSIQFGAASNVVDNDLKTKWTAANTDNEWITVDLGVVRNIGRIEFYWNYWGQASRYSLQVSDDGGTWQTVGNRTTGGGKDTVRVSTRGRYVRMQGIKRFSTNHPYSLFDLKVYPLQNFNAYELNEAEYFSDQSGVVNETCSEGGQDAGYLTSGDYLMFEKMDFENGAAQFEARVAGNVGGNIELRLDSPQGMLVGTCVVPNTGGWQNWQTVSCSVTGAVGVHTLYLVVSGGGGDLYNVNWFKFARNDFNAFRKIPAGDYSRQFGVQKLLDNEGREYLGYIDDGDYLVYTNVNFSNGAAGFEARVACTSNGGGNMEIRIDSINGLLLGTCQVQNTGGWQNWMIRTNTVIGVTGRHTLYLLFKGSVGIMNLNWFKFIPNIFRPVDCMYTSETFGLMTESCPAGGRNFSGITHGDYALFNDVDFSLGGLSEFRAAVACGGTGGNIEIRMDSPSGQLIGSCPVANTGGWQNWRNVKCMVSETFGRHDLYLVFTSSGDERGMVAGDLFKLKDFIFIQNPFERVDGENYYGQSGIINDTCSEGGMAAGWIDNGEMMVYKDMDFGAGTTNFFIRAATASAGGTIELRLDSPTGTLAGTCAVTNTGWWQNWQAFTSKIGRISQKHDLFLMFHGGGIGLFNIDYFKFGRTGFNAFVQNEAEWFTGQSGAVIVACNESGPSSDSGDCVGYLSSGDYISFSEVNFEKGAVEFEARVSAGPGGNIEVRLDGPTGPLIGNCVITNTGGWLTYKTFKCPVTGVSGVHSLYLVVAGGAGDRFNINWFKFSKGGNPFIRTEGVNYSAMSGILKTDSSEGGQCVGYIENGDYIVFTNMDFRDGASGFAVRTASATSGGNVELRLDSLTGTLIGTCPISGTGGWQNWVTKDYYVNGCTGKHTLYMVFTGGGGSVFNIKWFRFIPNAFQPVEGTYIDNKSGLLTQEICIEGDYNFTEIYDSDHLEYDFTDFAGGVRGFSARVASMGPGGSIEIRLGSADGLLLGTCPVSNTGGRQIWQDVQVGIAPGMVSGKNDLFLVFKGIGNKELFNLKSFRFYPDIYSRAEAEYFSKQSNIRTEIKLEGGLSVVDIEAGDFVRYEKIDFTNGMGTFYARVASGSAGGNIEIRIDSKTGPLIGTCLIPGTGGWQTWQQVSCPLSAVSGMHDLYLVFTGGAGFLFNLDWFKVVRSSASLKVNMVVTDVKLAGVTSALIPGSTLTYSVVYTNAGGARVTNAILYNYIDMNGVYKTNYMGTASGWVAEWSTNMTPVQTWISTGYQSVLPANKSRIRWVRWKKSSVGTGEDGLTIMVKVVIR